MSTSKTMSAGARVWGVALVASVGATACAPDPVPIDDTTVRPLSSALSLDPRIGQRGREAQDLAPISGGTLFVTSGDLAIVSDPDRDRIVVVDLTLRRVRGSVSVPGGQPGRIAEDARGRVHAVLRGSGEIVSFDPMHPADATRHEVCQSPRGIAFDASSDQLHVACRDGLLVTLGIDGNVTQRLHVDADDLRDVVAAPSGLVVSRFRAAELVQVGTDGARVHGATPISQVEGTDIDGNPIEFQPQVAWRTALRGNLIAVAHQRATDREIQLSQPDAYGGGGGGGGFPEGDFEGARRFPTSSCAGGIVRSTVSFFRSDDLALEATQALPSATLPVDVAIAPDGERFAVIAAGEQGQLPSVFEGSVHTPSDPCFGFSGFSQTVPGPIGVAYTSRGELVVQQRDPAALWIGGTSIPLGGETRFDAGHAIFHGNAGLGLACASCHPEGGDDGHVWSFAGFGSLRTPTLHGGILDTAPFHWNGDLPNIGALMNEVFERRMGGPSMNAREEGALARWIDELPSSPGREDLDTAAVDRGARLFWGEARCGDCHTGAQYTNNQTVDVGTDGPFQVPSLISVSFRLPVMHDGCATTLRDRFDPACGGGDQHGQTSQLNDAQLDDLVTYLETL